MILNFTEIFIIDYSEYNIMLYHIFIIFQCKFYLKNILYNILENILRISQKNYHILYIQIKLVKLEFMYNIN